MNKCAKCGTEFEGNFCLECGTPSQAPKKCPKCGAELKENIKFCNNCGYSFFDKRYDDTRKPAVTFDFDWRKLLQYLPVVFFGLWAVLLWAFYASNVIQGDGLFIENFNLYGLLSEESATKAYPLIYVFIVLAALADLYLIILIFVYIKGYSKKIANIVCYLLYIVVLIFDIVFAAIVNKQLKEEGFEDVIGNFAAVNISLTAVFAFLQGVALFLVNKFVPQTADNQIRRSKQPSSGSSKIGQWFYAHKGLVFFSVVVIVITIGLCVRLLPLLGSGINGTYYMYLNSTKVDSQYYTLKNGSWSNESDESGNYELNGNDITMYIDIFGTQEEYQSGTVDNGVLALQMGRYTIYYCKDGVTPPNLTSDSHSHTFSDVWTWNDSEHWHASTCEHDVRNNIESHIYGDDGKCIICGYDNLKGVVYTLLDSGQGYYVSNGQNATSDYVEILSQYKGLPVISIGDWAFFNCSLTSITIPDSVTSIGEYAFYDCDNLVSVNFGKNSKLDSIGDDAFFGCYSLTEITVPASITNIGYHAFYGCDNLQNVTFENPEGWKAGNTNLTLDNPSKNAEYLTQTYCDDDWTRK